MKYPVRIEGFEGQCIEVQTAGIFSSAQLLVNGQPAPKGQKRNEMLLRHHDGREAIATWKPLFLGLDVPQLEVEGKTIRVVEPLKWYEWAWGGLPVLLICAGGFLGAMAGMIGLAINTRVFRSSFGGVIKYVITGAVSLLVVIIYLVVAVMVSGAMNKAFVH